MKKRENNITPAQALNRLMEQCSRKEKSVAEITTKLKQWGLENESEEIVAQLKADDFLNEERFARAFLNDKMRFNKWGKIKISFMLSKHAIPDQTITKVFEELDEEDYYELVAKELGKKRSSIKNLSGYHLKAKLYSFAQQRGYEPDVINRYFAEEPL